MPTVSDLIRALNPQYPTGDDFPPGSMLHDIWRLEALPSNSLPFQAVTAPYELSPALKGRFFVSAAEQDRKPTSEQE